MSPNAALCVVDPDDSIGLDSLAAQVRDWEPSLELVRPPADALLYEPDGTLYAICLSETVSLTIPTDARPRVARRGDALVIPQAYALDARPVVDMIGLCHSGPPPDHFRERFIQVWGFDLLPSPHDDPSASGRTEVIREADARFRVPYAVIDVQETDDSRIRASGEVRLLVALSGDLRVEPSAASEPAPLPFPPRGLLLMPAGATWRVLGTGRVGVLTVLNVLSHEARREGSGENNGEKPSPEYAPPAGG